MTLDNKKAIKVFDGYQKLDLAIEKLNKFKPITEGHIKWSMELYEASLSHVIDIGPKGMLGNESSLGLSCYDRIPGPLVPGMLSEL